MATARARNLEHIPVSIYYSPNVELMASLHAIADIENHPRVRPYADEVCSTMPSDRLEQMRRLSDLTVNWRFAMDLVSIFEKKEIDETAEFLLSLDNVPKSEFAAMILSDLVSPERIEALRTSSQALEEWDGREIEHHLDLGLARTIIADKGNIQHSLTSFISWYWTSYFSREWNRIAVPEMETMSLDRQLLRSYGTEQYLRSCHPNLVIDSSRIYAADRPWLSYDISRIERINVFLSAYVAPHLMLNFSKGQLVIYKPININDRPPALISDKVFTFIKAIGSETRMDILQELSAAPMTNKELAERLGIATSSMTAHLKLLREAELIRPQQAKTSSPYVFLKENYDAQLSYLKGIFD